jgi:sulfur carrier protein
VEKLARKIKIRAYSHCIMNAKISINGTEYDITCGQMMCDAVRSLGYAPDAFIFMIEGRPVPMDTLIADGVSIKAIKVASGG